MNRSELMEGLGHVSCEYIAEAEDYRRAKRSSSAVRWGALAACAALVALGAFVALRPAEVEPPEPVPEPAPAPIPAPTPEPAPTPTPEPPIPEPDPEPIPEPPISNPVPGPEPNWPDLPEGMDSYTYQEARFPEGETIEDVAYVEGQQLTEWEDAAAVPEVGEHLPETLPNGYFFASASLTTTVMKDGTAYYRMTAGYHRTEPDGRITMFVMQIAISNYTVTEGTRFMSTSYILDYDGLTAEGLREQFGEEIPRMYVNCDDFSVLFTTVMDQEDAEWVMEVLEEME